MITFLNIENIIYIIFSLSLIITVLFIWNIRLELRIKKLMRGKNGSSLESSFNDMQGELRDFAEFRTEMEKYLLNIEKRLKGSIRGFHNISFNAFHGLESGGKSFATVFLNENGDGIILSSLQARDRLNIFAKLVKNYKTETELSDEEKLALTKAKESCSL